MRSGDIVRATPRGALALIAIVSAALAGCSQKTTSDLDWAQSAVRRNANLELLQTDPASQALTVRVRTTGEVRSVRADELIAALPPSTAQTGATQNGGGLSAQTPPPANASATSSAGAPAIAASTSPSASSPGADAAAPSSDSSSPVSAAGASSSAAPRRVAKIERVSAADSAAADAAAAVADAAPPEEVSRAPSGAVPRAPDAHKVVSGPGYSIAVVGAPAAPSGAAAGDALAGNLPLEFRHEPIVCQGERMLHIDNRYLQFDGDAVSAEDGCDLHITNSRIVAQGTGVFARAANVHIENSFIEGQARAIDAADGAQIYVQASTFKGVIRRVDTAGFHDLGAKAGNQVAGN